ncbi:hypothetical protein HNY73_023134 [Argiope bruennichi]|uniref:Uncharacterized protein n=1 Tax=Argiope bruennichi TaxID=94029 RepID=A0A8T0E3Y3_ARGBR|nr:hypothetical protein HNY73_023134 [Argiope bruennichi]
MAWLDLNEDEVLIAAFFSCNALATTRFFHCGRDPRRCLLLSSNPLQPRGVQENAEAREIDTWYPIPRQKVLFDTRKNSEDGFASNFNKLDPRGADGYPHANDFPRSERLLEKGEAVEEFGIRFWSPTDGEKKDREANRMGGMERLVKWNDTPGGGALSFAVKDSEKKSNTEFGLVDTYRDNNTFTKTNKLGTRLMIEKPTEESGKFQNITAMDEDSVPSDAIPKKYLNTSYKQEKANDFLYVSVLPERFQTFLANYIIHYSDLKENSSFANSTEEENVLEKNHNNEFTQLNKDDEEKMNGGVETVEQDFKELNSSGQTSFVDFSIDKKENAYEVLPGIFNISDPNTNILKQNATNTRNKTEKSDAIYHSLYHLGNKEDSNKFEDIKIEATKNYRSISNISVYSSIVNLGPYKIVKINNSEFPEVVATIHLEIKDEKPIQLKEETADSDHILIQKIKLFQNVSNKNKNRQDADSLSVICDTVACLEEKGNLNTRDFHNHFHKTLPETRVPASFKRRRSIDALKTSHVRNISDFYSNKILKHDKRFARGADSPETGKLYQAEATDLKKDDFRIFSISDNVPVANESWKSYQTGTLVRDKVTTPPSLSNKVFPKNDSVPRFDDEGRKKFELQIDEEDSFDKDLGALKMETGIGDQLRNDIREREPNGGQYIYIRLRGLHSSLKELGKSRTRSIWAKEGAKYLRMPLRKVRGTNNNTFNSSRRSLRHDELVNYEDYFNSENGTHFVDQTANYYKNEQFISENAESNNNESRYTNNTLILFKLKNLDLNWTVEANKKDKNKFHFNKIEGSENKSKIPALFHYLRKNHEAEMTTELDKGDKELRNFNGRVIADKAPEFNSSQNATYIAFPHIDLNSVKGLKASRQKRQLQSLIFEKQFSRTSNKRMNPLFKHGDFNSEEANNGYFYTKLLPSLNILRNGDNSLNNRNQLSLVPRFNMDSNVFIIDKTPYPVDLSVFKFPYYSHNNKFLINHSQNKYLSRSRKIRDLFRNKDILSRWRILGRSATPGRNLTFVSYSQNVTNSAQIVSRPIKIRLRNWIRANIYKDRQATTIPRNFKNPPAIQRNDPEITLYFLLSPDEQRVIEFSPEDERPTSFPKRKSQRESEDEDEDTLPRGKTGTISPADQDSFISKDSDMFHFGTGIRNKTKSVISKQYERYAKEDNSENVTQITDDWLDSQWIYINGLGRDQHNDNADESSTIGVPSLTISPRTPDIFFKATTSNPVSTMNNPSTSIQPNDTHSTKEPWEDIQNIPSSYKPWEMPNEQWEKNLPWDANYNQWNVSKIPWNSPEGRWEGPGMPSYPEIDPWRRDKKPWNSHLKPWKATKQPWIQPVDPWEKGKRSWDTPNNAWEKENKPWNPPNDQFQKPPFDPWEKNKTPPQFNDKSWKNKNLWDSQRNVWGNRKSPWNSLNNSWNTNKKPWNLPIYPWKKENTPWSPPNDPWNKDKKPWNTPDEGRKITKVLWIEPKDPWEKDKRPWNPPVDPWEKDKKPWNPPVDPWEKDKRPQNPPVDPWGKDKRPWNPPVDPWGKDKRPWNPPVDPWEKNKKPWNPPVDPWGKDKRPWNPPVDLWEKEKVSWKLPVESWKTEKMPWNPPPNRWKMIKTPWDTQPNPWKIMKQQWGIPNDPWKLSFSWWDCKR